MLADRNVSDVRLSSLFAREFCPLCSVRDESTQENSARGVEPWCCPCEASSGDLLHDPVDHTLLDVLVVEA